MKLKVKDLRPGDKIEMNYPSTKDGWVSVPSLG